MGKAAFTPTDEQIAIIDAARTENDLKVIALAGTGKTTTMELASRAMPGRKGLYLAFNKAVQLEAAERFPKTVTAKTAHSLAYGKVGRKFQTRLNGPRVPAWQLAERFAVEGFSMGEDHQIPPRAIAATAAGTVRRFTHSADTEISRRHVLRLDGLTPAAQAALADHILPYAEAMWADLQDPGGDKAKFEHDTYLKIWALSDPVLPYDYIVMDEAQDANPVLLDVLAKQDQSQRILVGDPNQSIYCQPVGTMVTVPTMRSGKSVADDVRCQATECVNRFDYRDSKLCWVHHRQQQEGKPFTLPRPGRGSNKKVEIGQVPIESLEVGDLVCTFDGSSSHVHRNGRRVSAVTRMAHNGPMITIETSDGSASSYTPKHHCVVRVGDELKGKYIVYLMRRGDQFRIGRTKFFYSSQNNAFGLALRSSSENADAAWVLSVHDTEAEAALDEALTQHQFNIPGIRFEPSGDNDMLDVNRFWEKHGPNQEAAARCLEHHGRLMEFPLWTTGTGSGTLIGVRRPFVTAAANLIDGMRVLPFDNAIAYKNKRNLVAPKDRWVPITVTTEWYEGDIISLEVEGHHTYFADGILTHNSWRGAVDALGRWKAEATLNLTESFRFGPEVAAEANKWLQIPELECDLRVVGRGPKAVIGPVKHPNAILCRTNAGAVGEALDLIDQPRERVAIVGGGKAIKDMALAAIELQAGKTTSHPELAAFEHWEAVREYVRTEEGAEDLAVFVRLVDKHGPDVLIDGVDALVDEQRGRPTTTISTAHKAKGREWNSVRVGGDFFEPGLDEYGKLQRLDKSEAMLCYVTVTRAKRHLDNDSLAWVDYYLAGNASPEQQRRWIERQAAKGVDDDDPAPGSPAAVEQFVREQRAEEREYTNG